MDGAGSRSSLCIPGSQLAALLLMDRASYFQSAMDFIKILPLQSADLTPAQTGSQFRIEEVAPDAVPLNSIHELFQLFIRQHLFAFVTEFRSANILCRISRDEASLLRSPIASWNIAWIPRIVPLASPSPVFRFP